MTLAIDGQRAVEKYFYVHSLGEDPNGSALLLELPNFFFATQCRIVERRSILSGEMIKHQFVTVSDWAL